MMYVCIDCGETFEDAKRYIEKHNLDSPPYEEYWGCPYCGGSFTKAHKCEECGEWICGDYIKTTSGHRICENCYNTYELGEEDN